MATARQKSIRQKQHAGEKRLKQLRQTVGLVASPRSKPKFEEYKPEKTFRRQTKQYKSLDARSAVLSKKNSEDYTGNYITGFATMHKSNIVPVCKNQDPSMYAQMRRN